VRLGALAALLLSGVVAALATISDSPETQLLLPKTVRPEPLPIAFGEALLPAPASFVREERFQRGDTLAALLARLGIGETDARALARLPELRLARAGTAIGADVRADGALIQLSFVSPRDSLVRVERDGARLAVTETPAVLSTRLEMKSAEIRSSLFAATDAAGIPDGVAMQLADIFGGDIDFHRDLRQGDRFAVVYEAHGFQGRTLRFGRVVAAEFVSQGRNLRAIWYPAEHSAGYYAPDGKNLRKAFLRSPLEFSRVSSGFGPRLHPFLQTWRAHQGVDYAAPQGTRVRATSDGVVESAGPSGGYGNAVLVRHDSQNSTLYAHLSGFARGIRKGTRVAQGQTVGFVGQTGWATGPHLHYEFRVSGVARNPLRIALPAALPVAAQDMPHFRAQGAPLVARLDQLAGTRIALFE
jgi:murein DD-endopeptidase MepM/ murein hydrolase activator NlpD